jgi:hypothetical protein
MVQTIYKGEYMSQDKKAYALEVLKHNLKNNQDLFDYDITIDENDVASGTARIQFYVQMEEE